MFNYFYKIYGLCVKSDIPLQGLIFKTNHPDIIIHWDETIENIDHKNTTINQVKYNIPFMWENEVVFRVIDGKKILINSNTNLDNKLLRSLILGPGMGILLHQRGFLVLHGSAINLNGIAVAFLGPSGCGKSTICTGLTKKGHSLIADDVLCVKLENNNLKIYPSVPRIKLREDVLNHLTDSKDTLIEIPEIHKYDYNVGQNFSFQPLTLQKIYILKKGDNKLNILNPQDKLVAILNNNYPKILFGNKEKAQNLFDCAKLINNVSVKCLEVNHHLKRLPDLVKVVEKDMKGLKK